MKAVILYDSRLGNTEKFAKSLEIGLKAAGIDIVACTNTNDFPSVEWSG